MGIQDLHGESQETIATMIPLIERDCFGVVSNKRWTTNGSSLHYKKRCKHASDPLLSIPDGKLPNIQ